MNGKEVLFWVLFFIGILTSLFFFVSSAVPKAADETKVFSNEKNLVIKGIYGEFQVETITIDGKEYLLVSKSNMFSICPKVKD